MLAISVAIVAAGVLVSSPGVEGTWSDAAPLIGQSAVNLTAGVVVGVAVGAAALRGAVILTHLGPSEGAGLEQLFFDLTEVPA